MTGREVRIDEAADMVIRFYAELMIAFFFTGGIFLGLAFLVKIVGPATWILVCFALSAGLLLLSVPVCFARLWLRVRRMRREGAYASRAIKALCVAALLGPALGFGGLTFFTAKAANFMRQHGGTQR